MGEYELICLEGGERVDERYTLSCGNAHKGLLRTVYRAKRLNVRDSGGVFRFYDWLPSGPRWRRSPNRWSSAARGCPRSWGWTTCG